MLGFEGGYGRKAASGIAAFAQTRSHWILNLLDPDPSSAFSACALGVERCDGLIIQANGDPWITGVLESGVPTVNVGPTWPDLMLPHVGVDNTAVGRLVAEHLIDLGLKQFAFVGTDVFSFSRERLAGFQDELAGYGRGCEVCSGPSLQNEDGLATWMESLDKPLGICACSDSWGYRVLCATRLAGIKVPEDLAVVGADDDGMLCRWSDPPLSSVPVRADEIGYRAAAQLDRLLGGEPVEEDVLLQPGLVAVRGSSDQYYVEDGDVARALTIMRERAGSGVCVEDLLREIGLSRRRLEQKFESTLGISPGKVLTSMRVRRIKRLLLETGLTMKEIADEVGYATPQHMSHVFRQAEGCSPSRYRTSFSISPSSAAPDRVFR